jgi:hypothetical protein
MEREIPFRIANAEPVTPPESPVGPPSASVIDVQAASVIRPVNAPVGPAPLSGRERAGVYLTWGMLGLILVFLIFILVALALNESHSHALAYQVLQGPIDAAKLQAIGEERAAFRTFWLELTKTVLLNVFLPVLTALLGFVFGTTNGHRTTT